MQAKPSIPSLECVRGVAVVYVLHWMWMLTVPPIMGACYVLCLFTDCPCNKALGPIRRAGGS
jgi:hypothetical protein